MPEAWLPRASEALAHQNRRMSRAAPSGGVNAGAVGAGGVPVVAVAIGGAARTPSASNPGSVPTGHPQPLRWTAGDTPVPFL